MTKRKQISQKVRFEIFKRDQFTCQYCGAHPPKTILHVDHINPVANGGDNSDDNLITSCDCCNLGKGARLLSAVPQSLADKAKDIAEREKQIKGYNAVVMARLARIEEESWSIASRIEGKPEIESYPKANLKSIRYFLESLGLGEVTEAAMKADARACGWSENRRFRYFCAVCWGKIKEEQQ